MKTYTEQQMMEMGNNLARVLKMRRDTEHAGRWQTTWGSKTGLGLWRTIEALVDDAHKGDVHDDLIWDGPTTTFKALAVGERFEFDSSYSMPLSGMERGPWVKTSARRYEKPGMKCRVGSIAVEVRRVS